MLVVVGLVDTPLWGLVDTRRTDPYSAKLLILIVLVTQIKVNSANSRILLYLLLLFCAIRW